MPVRERNKNGKPVINKKIAKDTEVTKVNVDDQRGTVTIEKGFTKNIGDFSSARISVRMTLPLGFTDEDVTEAKRTIKKVNSVIDLELNNQADELVDLLRSIE